MASLQNNVSIPLLFCASGRDNTCRSVTHALQMTPTTKADSEQKKKKKSEGKLFEPCESTKNDKSNEPKKSSIFPPPSCMYFTCAARKTTLFRSRLQRTHLARLGVSFEDLWVVVLELVRPLLLRPGVDPGVFCCRPDATQPASQTKRKKTRWAVNLGQTPYPSKGHSACVLQQQWLARIFTNGWWQTAGAVHENRRNKENS